MAMIPTEFDQVGGWQFATLTPKSGSSAVSNYGNAYAAYNNDIHMAMIFFEGNSTTPVAGTYEYAANSNIKSFLGSILTTMRYPGTTMGVNSEGRFYVNLNAQNWNSGLMTFATTD